MEARLIPLPSPTPDPSIRVDGDRILVDRLTVVDGRLAGFLADRPSDEWAGLAERAFRVGLIAIQSAGVTMNADVVKLEFERLVDQTTQANERAATTLETVLRANFADGDGRLPRTLEAFLGDKGRLRTMVDELFDPTRRDSAIGRIGTMLERYFDGDTSKLATLLDPTRAGSPLSGLRDEIADGFRAIGDRLVALEASATARASERARSAAKGADFEDLLESMLADIARGGGDLFERTATGTGDTIRSKKGDFVLTVDPERTRGADLRVVIEAKDRKVSGREMRDELREARLNRAAATALVVFSAEHAPAGIAPFDVRGGDVYCVIDPTDPSRSDLEGAVRLARILALHTLRDAEVEVDAAAVATALTAIKEQLDAIKGMKAQLTSIGTAAGAVAGGLDRLRDGVIGQIVEAEKGLGAARRAT